MFRPAARAIARRTTTSAAGFASRRTPVARRWASTAGADAPRSWKSGLARWGLAGAAVYYYNTSSVFAEEATAGEPYAHYPPPAVPAETESLPTLESYAKKPKQTLESSTEATLVPGTDAAGPGGPADLEAEAAQQGAFNEETGEINWDCPCLGGMADGPCGEEFKAAFSCFVYSGEEPKGVDCIDKFKGMQDCFRLHPDVYGAELEDDENDEHGEDAPAVAVAKDAGVEGSESESADAVSDPVNTEVKADEKEDTSVTETAKTVVGEVKTKLAEKSESEEAAPKA